MDLVVTRGRGTALYRMGMANITTTLSRVDMGNKIVTATIQSTQWVQPAE
jgi:hypothetical protein